MTRISKYDLQIFSLVLFAICAETNENILDILVGSHPLQNFKQIMTQTGHSFKFVARFYIQKTPMWERVYLNNKLH